MTAPSLRDLWASLRESDSGNATSDLRLRLCKVGHGVRVFAAVAGLKNDLALVVEIPADLLPERLNGLSARRFSVTASGVPGLPPSRGAIVVRLHDSQFEDLFTSLAEDVLSWAVMAPTSEVAVQRTVRAIERWRQFVERRSAPLSVEEVRGLVGELRVLERLVRRMGPGPALRSWKAPQGAIRDFECDDRSIEVKTYSTSAGATVHISDPLQLQPDPGVPLILACLELGRSPLAELSLPGHVHNVASLFPLEGGLQEEFTDAMALCGYMEAHASFYPDGFAVGALSAFRVTSDFPRLAPTAIPPGVLGVSFSLSVNSLGVFGVDPEMEIGPLLTSTSSATS